MIIFCLLSCDDSMPLTPAEPEISCSDGIQNGDETDVDCGGLCPACISCDDGIQNGDETGVDCGGTCPNACPSCDDGMQNGDETDIDCGGSCPACISCDDGIQNGDETGVDCGGTCPNACPTCDDGVQNGDETGIDCGGICGSCVLGSYLGSLTCPTVLSIINDNEFAFTISESDSGEMNEVNVFLENIDILLEGTINGSEVSLNYTILDYPFDANGDGQIDLSVDFQFMGTLELDADGSSMAGNLDIEVKSSDTGAVLGIDSCLVDAVKQ